VKKIAKKLAQPIFCEKIKHSFTVEKVALFGYFCSESTLKVNY
jgi:hypothetical protein